ncbi:MAG: hypothetical protein KAR38_00730 [Calditrichia bacterium]|nr:hypothetical protein [Calditrichia bacterium]
MKKVKKEVNKKLDSKFKSPAALLSHILKNYFRIYPEESLDTYVDNIRKKTYFERIESVKNTKYPDVIIALSKDTDHAVKDEAYRTEFWQFIGKHLEIIDFSRKEKIKLLQDENLLVLLTFLLFENDIRIINEVINHPIISLQMILEYERFLRARGFGLNDQKILNSIANIVQERKKRFHSISSIIEAKSKANIKGYNLLFNKLLDEDPVIQKSALNALETMPVSKLIKILQKPEKIVLLMNGFIDMVFDVLIYLYHYFIPSEEIKTSDVFDKEIFNKTSRLEVIWQKFMEMTIIQFLEEVGKDITQFTNLLTVVKAHKSSIKTVSQKAQSILPLTDVFTLITEELFPIASSKIIANVLEKHPDEEIRQKVQNFYMQESERLRKKLKEMELSVNAYFDIVFDTLGYPQISLIRQNLKMLNQSFRLFEGFFNKLKDELLDSRKGFLKIYYLLIKNYQKQLEAIYTDISEKRLEEISELYEVLQLIYDVKQSFIDSEIDTKNAEYNVKRNKRLIKQAEIIWSSSMSLYLGRIKELDDILRKKWLYYLDRIGDKSAKWELVEEMKNVIQEMEAEHKLSVSCTLPVSCKVCQKRSCASVRFINQVEFFASELIDFIQEDKEE